MRLGLNGEDSLNTNHVFYLSIVAVGETGASGKVVSRGLVRGASGADLKPFSTIM
jgi:hypothetical protein